MFLFKKTSYSKFWLVKITPQSYQFSDILYINLQLKILISLLIKFMMNKKLEWKINLTYSNRAET